MSKYPLLVKTNWSATARLVGSNRSDVYNVANGKRVSKRISAALQTLTVQKICWQTVAELASTGRPTPYKAKHVYEVAKGFRENKQLFELLWKMRIIELLKRQDEEAKRIKESFTNSQTAEV